MSAAITVSKLEKVYKHYWGPRSLLKEVLFGVTSHSPQWALKDVSFEIPEGQAFGVIGANGAGKSTLLKILAGTTFPTSGTAEVDGRVSALLELGAGFHPDFSGRENVYFNGALMSLSRAEVQRREQEIIEFSELAEFIDKPVKTYSSGMFLRLGFAVATGFDPKVLIIDEALAVGDQHFQKKCTDRIMQFRRAGKTIIFCSHNLYQVRTLCERALWLDRGIVKGLGNAASVVDSYTNELRQDEGEGDHGAASGLTTADKERLECWIERVALSDAEGRPTGEFRTGDTVRLDIWAFFRKDFSGKPGIAVALVRNDGLHLYTTANTIDGVDLVEEEPGRFYGRLIFPNLALLSGLYHFNVVTTDEHNMQAYHIVERAASFSVLGSTEQGSVRLEHEWAREPRPA
jgi:lipopolysaccharide transport system ATP-binding protein